jgi:hypothetical protein
VTRGRVTDWGASESEAFGSKKRLCEPREENHEDQMKHAPFVLPLLFAITLSAHAQESRQADCTVRSDGEIVFDGPCDFLPEAGGTFSIASAESEDPLYGEISVITVFVVAPGEAEVSGLTTSGINSRWGAAQRSTSDPACWTGTDFEICAR